MQAESACACAHTRTKFVDLKKFAESFTEIIAEELQLKQDSL